MILKYPRFSRIPEIICLFAILWITICKYHKGSSKDVEMFSAIPFFLRKIFTLWVINYSSVKHNFLDSQGRWCKMCPVACFLCHLNLMQKHINEYLSLSLQPMSLKLFLPKWKKNCCWHLWEWSQLFIKSSAISFLGRHQHWQ